MVMMLAVDSNYRQLLAREANRDGWNIGLHHSQVDIDFRLGERKYSNLELHCHRG